LALATEAKAAFFSYSHHDSEFALRLAKDLKAAGAIVWMDQLDIKGGQRWDRTVQEALINCPCILVILSPAAVESDNVFDEIDLALEKKKLLIPVFYRVCEIPLRLRRIQRIDFSIDYADGLNALLKIFGVEQAPRPSTSERSASSAAVPKSPPIDPVKFWEELLAYIERGRVIPVVGAELLTVEEGGKRIPLYRAVAERLLNKYGLPAEALPGGEALRDHHELNDAVSVLARAGCRIRDLYRPVNDILGKVLAEHTAVTGSLYQIASIGHFNLFATTTPDDLLARALDHVRFSGARQTDEIVYAPQLPPDHRRDIPAVMSPKYTAVFYLFGKADVSPFYAIHDEDALEFPYTMQADNGAGRMLSELRNRSLLFIGCNIADWPFFLRLTNSERLSSVMRTKCEFFVGEETIRDRKLTDFLERFSASSQSYPGDARDFVSELYKRWSERNSTARIASPSLDGQTGPSTPLSPSFTIFISYSGDDIEAAKRLFADVQEIGGDVAWFDKSGLNPGDEWEEQLKSAVQRCGLFLPLISANTELHPEGYFRLEWSEAAERSKTIQGRPFILPIVIDPEYDGYMGRYVLVPEAFRAFQSCHAPAGQMPDILRAEIRTLLRNLRRASSV
jgi:hypothetical protein